MISQAILAQLTRMPNTDRQKSMHCTHVVWLKNEKQRKERIHLAVNPTLLCKYTKRDRQTDISMAATIHVESRYCVCMANK